MTLKSLILAIGLAAMPLAGAHGQAAAPAATPATTAAAPAAAATPAPAAKADAAAPAAKADAAAPVAKGNYTPMKPTEAPVRRPSSEAKACSWAAI